MQDIPAIAAVAHAHDAIVLMDNTWATPLFFTRCDNGVDISIQSGTKYIGGHSDLMLGTVSANERRWQRLTRHRSHDGPLRRARRLYLGLRGLRTHGGAAAARISSPALDGRALARSSGRKSLRVLHPGAARAIPATRSGSAISPARADCSAWCSSPMPEKAVHAFLNALTLFGIGASWGGFESLAIPFDCSAVRTATKWAPGGPSRPLPYRARRRRRPDRRPRARLRGAGRRAIAGCRSRPTS